MTLLYEGMHPGAAGGVCEISTCFVGCGRCVFLFLLIIPIYDTMLWKEYTYRSKSFAKIDWSFDLMCKLLNNKGSILIEYIIILSFIGAIAIASIGDKGFVGMAGRAASDATYSIKKALGLVSFDEEVLKNKLVGLKDLENYKTVFLDHGGQHASLGSDIRKDGDYKTDAAYQNDLVKSQTLEDDFLAGIDFGDVPLESWRFLNERILNENYAYLIWSDTDWGAGDLVDNTHSKTPCMYARVDKTTNEVSFGVAYTNPIYIHGMDGSMNKWTTNGCGMVTISEGVNDSLTFERDTWDNANLAIYKDANSPYFTKDYGTAVKLYQDLKSKAQGR